MKIRQFRREDAEAVWNLHNLALHDVGAHAGDGPWDDDLHAIEDVYLKRGGDFLVGFVDDRLVTMVALKKTDPRRAELKRMRVHPNYQRRGLGQMMLIALEARAQSLGYKEIHLDTTTVQEAAQKLYEKNGYRKVGENRVGKFDTILYEKHIARGEMRGGNSRMMNR